jgi:tRNA modification GTPase
MNTEDLGKCYESILDKEVRKERTQRKRTISPAYSVMNIIRLTPVGRGAVASFLLCGKNIDDTFLAHWHGKVPDERPRWGRLQLTEAGLCEEAVVHRTADGIEMHVHGGEQVASAIVSLFQRKGAACKTWQEHFTADNSQQDLAQQNLALRLLPFAPTERTVQILLDQYNGAFDREMSAIERLPDGEERQRRLNRLQELAPLSKHLVEPYRVVLAGASNAGKSSLLNAFLGFQRSLVHSLPGTTRDVVSGQTALDGFPVSFFDTAGFRVVDDVGDDLELQGIDRSLRSLADADLVVWVIDSTVEESHRPACPTESNVLMCYNKMDLVPHLAGTPALPACLPVSALTGEGIETLLDCITRRLVPHPPQQGEAVPIGMYA